MGEEKIKKQFEIVMSEGNYGFQEVLNDFSNAKYIYIVTYNISEKKKDELLDLLIEYGSFKDINLVTNIPGRFETYYNTYYRDRAQKKINVYKEKLDYNVIGEQFTPSFDFNNHMKIVMTNNVAYIGSQNFSQESKNNKECGVIIRDKDEINDLIDWFNTYISSETIAYNKRSIRMLYDVLNNIEEELLIHYQFFIEKVFGYDDEPYIKVTIDCERYYINEDTVTIKLSELNDLHTTLDSYYEIISEVYQIYEDDYYKEISKIDNFINNLKDNINSIYKNITDFNVIEFFNFDSEGYTNDLLFDKYALDAYDEMLNECMDYCTDEAFDHKSKLFSQCESNLLEINKSLKNIKEEIKTLIADCEQVLDNYEIDNTK